MGCLLYTLGVWNAASLVLAANSAPVLRSREHSKTTQESNGKVFYRAKEGVSEWLLVKGAGGGLSLVANSL